MQSVTSYSEKTGGTTPATVPAPTVNGWFNLTLMRKNLSRFWPLWALYIAIWLMMWPLAQLIQAFGRSSWYYNATEMVESIADYTLQIGVYGGMVMGIIFGVLFAMVLFSYLNTPRSVSMFHGFPIRREGLFLTNYLTGLLVAAAGPVISMLLTIVVQLASNTLNGYAVGMGLLCSLLPILFFYSFAVLCAMLTGQILAIPVFYGIFNFFVAGIYFLVQQFATSFYFGFTASNIPLWVTWLTPIYHMTNHVDFYSKYRDGITDAAFQIEGMPILAVYAVAGVALAALALVIYRRRKSESAGDVVAIRWAKPLFLFGVAFSAAISLGQLIYHVVWAEFSGSRSINFPIMLFCVILMGWLGYYAAEMLLKKSFRVFRGGLRGAAGLTAGLVIFGLAVNFDLLGVENRIPAVSEVENVSMSIYGQGRGSSSDGGVSGEENIAMIQAVQQALLAEKDTFQRWENQDNDNYTSVHIKYVLKNGSTVYRYYDLQYNESQVSDSPALSLLAQTATAPALQHAGNDIIDLDRFTGGDLLSNTVDEYGNTSYSNVSDSLTAQQAQTLYDALQRDIDAGHVGKNVLLRSQWYDETYANEVNLYYQIKNPEEYDDGTRSFTFNFSIHCTELVAALEEMGLVTEEHPLITYSEQERRNNAAMGSETDYPVDYGYSESADYAYELAGTAEVVTIPKAPVG